MSLIPGRKYTLRTSNDFSPIYFVGVGRKGRLVFEYENGLMSTWDEEVENWGLVPEKEKGITWVPVYRNGRVGLGRSTLEESKTRNAIVPLDGGCAPVAWKKVEWTEGDEE